MVVDDHPDLRTAPALVEGADRNPQRSVGTIGHVQFDAHDGTEAQRPTRLDDRVSGPPGSRDRVGGPVRGAQLEIGQRLAAGHEPARFGHAQALGQEYLDLSGVVAGQYTQRLAGRHHLAGLAADLEQPAVGVGRQLGIAEPDPRLLQSGACRIDALERALLGQLDAFEYLRTDELAIEQIAIPTRLVARGFELRTRCLKIGSGDCHDLPEFFGIEQKQHLAFGDPVAGVDPALGDATRDLETDRRFESGANGSRHARRCRRDRLGRNRQNRTGPIGWPVLIAPGAARQQQGDHRESKYRRLHLDKINERARIVFDYAEGMVKPARGRPADPTKDRDILHAGRSLLFEHGPQAVTMEAVARAAGIAKPTLYRRYANRDELLAAIALNESESMAGRFGIAPGSADDLKRALSEFGRDLTRFLFSREHIRFIHTLGASAGMSQASRESIYRNGPLATRDRLATWLASASERGLLQCTDPESSAEQLIGMLMGLNLVRTLYRVQSPREVSERDPRVERIVRDFLRLHAAGD